MYKLIISIALLAVVKARPGLLGSQTTFQTIGTVVNHIPTAITHQSQTQIHSQPIVTSILSPTIGTIATHSVVHEAQPILSSGILSSDILSSGLFGEHKQLIAGEGTSLLHGGTSIIGSQQTLVENKGLSFIGNHANILDNHSSLINDSEILTESIGDSELTINALHQ